MPADMNQIHRDIARHRIEIIFIEVAVLVQFGVIPACAADPLASSDGFGMFRQRAGMVAKLLRGARPADLPIEQPSTFKLVINLKTAKAINYAVPTGLALRADKVIE